MISAKEAGNRAEKAATQYLEKFGYRIVCRNWRTRRCEIDIVAYKNSCIYFVEVKFRSGQHKDKGMEAITAAKLRQMEYAARIWVARNGWLGEYCLSVASLSSFDSEVKFIEQL